MRRLQTITVEMTTTQQQTREIFTALSQHTSSRQAQTEEIVRLIGLETENYV